MFCGIDAHKRFHVAAQGDQGGAPRRPLAIAKNPHATPPHHDTHRNPPQP